MLHAQGVVDLLLELDVRVDFVRHGNGSVKSQSVPRGGATFTLGLTHGTFRTLAVSVRALFHFNFDSF
jgi:hypothetical protein